MVSLFLFALILGGGLLALSMLGDLFGGADVDADLGTDLEVDEIGSGGPAAGGGAGAFEGAFRLFTLRNLTYFLFGFGAIGWGLMQARPELGTWTITVAAVAGGGGAAGLAMVIFGWVKATDSGWRLEEESFVGCEGRVVLPLGHGKVGQIVVRRGDREHELRALPFQPGARAPEGWRTVMVIEMDGGTARVSPMEALAPAEGGPANT